MVHVLPEGPELEEPLPVHVAADQWQGNMMQHGQHKGPGYRSTMGP